MQRRAFWEAFFSLAMAKDMAGTGVRLDSYIQTLSPGPNVRNQQRPWPLLLSGYSGSLCTQGLWV